MVIAYIGGSAKNDTKKAFRLSLTMAGGLAASEGIRHMRSVQVYDLQGLHAGTLP